jgi:hypothetical protein
VTDSEAARAADPHLLDLALQASYGSEGTLLDALSRPRWDDYRRWPSAVPCGLRDRWDALPIDLKLAVYLTARAACDGDPLD